MNKEIKQQLINELEKYDGNGSLIIKKYPDDITLYELLDNEILMKKILENNEYGPIANLLNENKNNLDSNILTKLCIKDYKNDKKRYGGIIYLLENDKSLRNKLLNEKKNIKELIETFGNIIFYYLNDDFKNNKEIVYEVFKNTNLINYNTYLNGTLKDMYKEILSNIDINDACQLSLSILPEELKNDVEITKLILKVVYGFYAEDKEYTIKELHLEYANSLKEQLENGGSIYGRKLCYTEDLPLSLLNDREFIKSIIDVDEEKDRLFLEKKYNLPPQEEVKIDINYSSQLNNSSVFRMLGKTYMKSYHFEEAIQEFEKGIKTYPYYHGCYCDKAECLIRLGKLDEAIIFLKNVITSEKLKNADKIYYSSCSNDATYTKYTYKLFIKIIENKLKDIEDKKARGYIYKPRPKKDYI